MIDRGIILLLKILVVSLLLATTASAQQIKNAIPYVARPLPLSAVRLTGGPLKHAQDLDAEYLLKLEPDRMLAYYRKQAGLEPKAPGLTGWDGDGRNLTGHIAGHYLSAVSLMYAATGDQRFKARADYIVKQLQEVQDKNGDGFAGALEGVREKFKEVAAGNIRSTFFDLNGLWSPRFWLMVNASVNKRLSAFRPAAPHGISLRLNIRFRLNWLPANRRLPCDSRRRVVMKLRRFTGCGWCVPTPNGEQRENYLEPIEGTDK